MMAAPATNVMKPRLRTMTKHSIVIFGRKEHAGSR